MLLVMLDIVSVYAIIADITADILKVDFEQLTSAVEKSGFNR